jgi:hypothetical protein
LAGEGAGLQAGLSGGGAGITGGNNQPHRTAEADLLLSAIEPSLPCSYMTLSENSAAITFSASICAGLTVAEKFHGKNVALVAGTAGGILGAVICVGYYVALSDVSHAIKESERKGGNPRKYLWLIYTGLLFGIPVVASILSYFLVGYFLAAMYS